MEIKYITNDKRLEIKLQYVVGNPIRYHKGIGKSWPKQTQCLCFLNDFLLSFSTVTKHSKDIDNPSYAIRLVSKKALASLKSRSIRKEIWKLINEKYPLHEK